MPEQGTSGRHTVGMTSPVATPRSSSFSSRTVAVLLAAGAGSRFQGTRDGTLHKLDSVLPPTSTEPSASVFERSLRHVVDAAIGPIVVVTGAWTPAAERHVLLADIEVVHNPDWADGQITSVHVGLAAAGRLGATRAVVGLADQPFVVADAWRAVAHCSDPIGVATYGGRRANPVGLDQSIWPLLPTTGDEGARTLMRVRPDLVGEVACAGSPTDIDTAEDLRRWQKN